MIRRFAVLCVSLCMLLAPSAAPAQDLPSPFDVPDKAAVDPVRAALRKRLRSDYRSKDAAVRSKLARRLLEDAEDAKSRPVERYVLLDEAVAVAASAGDVALSMEALDRMAGAFAIARPERGLRALKDVGRATKNPVQLTSAATALVALAGHALAADDVKTALTALGAAKKLAKSAKVGGLAARADTLSRFARGFKSLASDAAKARETLKNSPDDPNARLALGRFLCFGRNAWDEGIPHLAAGSDTQLADVALLEAGADSDPKKLGDAWWERASSAKASLVAARALARAVHHYRRALPSLTGQAAEEVQERLDSITYTAWDETVATRQDYSRYGPADLALATIRTYIKKQRIDRKTPGWKRRLPRFPDVAFGTGATYFWHLQTNHGEITLRFFHETAPRHVANFLYLTELGFFDGLGFHRVIPGFMAQGGCPTGNGSGDPGYFFEGETDGGARHDKPGMLSMANTGRRKSDGSQFFITFVPRPGLDGKHTVFGEVTGGMDVVRKLEQEGTPAGPPKSPLDILRAWVTVND